jgi:uncharacterized protein (TIGR03118 family)
MGASTEFRLVKWLAAVLAVSMGAGICAFAQDTLAQYTQTNLVSSQGGVAQDVDSDLVNAWGLSRSSASPWWVADNGSGKSTLYLGDGTKQSLVVNIPSGDPTVSATGTPTGTIFNGSATDFLLAPGKPALFLFVTEDGTVSGWNPGVKPTDAVIKVNTKGTSVFKGATVAQIVKDGISETFLFVADFRKGRVQVYDAAFNPVPESGASFSDHELPEGYAPFNVQNIGGSLYVTFALQDADKHDELDGPGRGYVDIFSPSGILITRLEHNSLLDGPWGLAMASSDFGRFSHDILVGQFGSGQILVYNPLTGDFVGRLLNKNNNPIVIDGLWAIAFGNDANAGPATTLFFTAGPSHESQGLFGTITAIQNIQGNDR